MPQDRLTHEDYRVIRYCYERGGKVKPAELTVKWRAYHDNRGAARAKLDYLVSVSVGHWKSHIPMPKSREAAWGNYDGRTTWWNGGWFNSGANQYSTAQPAIDADGNISGDGQDWRGWRTGGSPLLQPDHKYFVNSEVHDL